MFKRTALAALLVGLTAVAQAAMYTPPPPPECKPGKVMVPCEMSAWDFSVEALSFEQREGPMNQIFADQFYDWQFGFRLAGSYHWGKGFDATVDWMHYNTSTEDPLNALDMANTNLIGNINAPGVIPGAAGGAGLLRTRLLDASSHFDIVNVSFGEVVDFGEVVSARFFGGIQGAYLENSLSGDNLFTDGAWVQKISGWGPRAGADLFYHYGQGVSFFTKGAIAVLSAKDFNSSRNGGLSDAGAPNSPGALTQATATNGTRRMGLTVTEYKLGAEYIQPLAHGDLTWLAAWEAHDYINASLGGAGDLAWDGLSFGLHWLGMA